MAEMVPVISRCMGYNATVDNRYKLSLYMVHSVSGDVESKYGSSSIGENSDLDYSSTQMADTNLA